MRPTFSIIFFTVVSGAGYGLWLLVGLTYVLVWPGCMVDPSMSSWDSQASTCGVPSTVTVAWAVGFVLVSAGLLSSLAHLGQPQRAWRALSQWRSSWLSREGVAAFFTYVPAAGLFAIWLSQQNPGFFLGGLSFDDDVLVHLAGAALAAGCVLTVFCTANIYACLKPIRAWHNRLVVPSYLVLAAFSGMLMLWALLTLPRWDVTPARQDSLWASTILLAIIGLAAISGAIKMAYWRQIDQPQKLTAGDATGLGSLGEVRSFEQPHTEENYLTHEMGFRVARNHSRRLRVICLLAGFAVPAILALLSLTVPGVRFAAAWLSLLSGMLGIFIERWLFFAEAKHAVMLYYGARSD